MLLGLRSLYEWTRTPAQLLNIGVGSGKNHFGVDIAETGAPARVFYDQAQIEAGLVRSPYFAQSSANPEAVRFYTTVNAPTTSGSEYPRVELREVTPDGLENYAFDPRAPGKHVMRLRTRVTQQMLTKPDIILTQLHSGEQSDSLAIRTGLSGSGVLQLNLRVTGILSSSIPKPRNPYAVGDEVEIKVEVDGDLEEVRVYIDNMVTPFYTFPVSVLAQTSGATFYFKCGLYLQSNTTTENGDTSQAGAAEIRRLQHWHTGWPVPENYVGWPNVDAGVAASATTGQTFTRTGIESGTGITSRSWSVVSGPDSVGQILSTTAALSWAPTSDGQYLIRYAATNERGTNTSDFTLTTTGGATSSTITPRTAVATQSAGTTSTDTLTADLPANRQTDDYVVVEFNAPCAASKLVRPASEWIELIPPTDYGTTAGSLRCFAVYGARNPTSAPTASFVADTENPINRWGAVAQAFSNVHATTPIDVAGFVTTRAAGPSVAAASVNIVTPGAMLVSGGIGNRIPNATAYFTQPSEMILADQTVGGRATAMATERRDSAGATGTRTWTWADASTTQIQPWTVALRPAQAAATTAPTVNAGADASVEAGTAFTRTASTTGSTITARSWQVIAGPFDVGSVISTTAALNWTPMAPGTYTLRYSATNAAGTGTDDVVITVTPVASAAAFTASVATGQNTNSSPTVAVPTGTVSGNYQLLFLYIGIGTETISAVPAGWAEIAALSGTHAATASGTWQIRVYESTTATGVANFTKSGSNSWITHRVRYSSEITGRAQAAQIIERAAAPSQATPSLTPARAGNLIVGFIGCNTPQTTEVNYTPPSNWTERTDTWRFSSGADEVDSMSVADFIAPSTAAVTGSFGVSVSDEAITGAIELTTSGSGATAPTVDAGADTSVATNSTVNRTAGGTGSVSKRQWIVTSGPASVGTILSTTAVLNWTPVVSGTYVLTYSAGNTAGTASDSMTLTVSSTPPTADAGADTAFYLGQSFIRTGVDNNAAITLREWRIISGPAQVDTVLSTTADVTWQPSATGTYVLRYSTANVVGTASDDVTVTVNPILAPSVNAGADASIAVGAAFARTATENDNGSTVTARQWRVIDGPFDRNVVVGTAAALSWTPTAPGAYTLRYTSTNGIGSGSDELVLTVTGQGTTPVPAEYRSSSFDEEGNTTPVALPKPAGLAVGDAMLVFQNSDTDGDLASMTAPTVPGGETPWATIASSAGNGGTGAGYVKVWWKVATANDVSKTDFTFLDGTGANCSANMILMKAGTFDTANPYVTPTVTLSNTAAASQVAPTITGVDSGYLICAFMSETDSNVRDYVTPIPSGMTALSETTQTKATYTLNAIYGQALTADGPTGTRTATISAAEPYISVSVVIRPAPPVAPAAPVVNAGVDQTVATNAAVTRTASESGTITRREWSIIGGPLDGQVLSTTAALNWTPTTAGTYTLRYSAANTGGSTSDTAVITVYDPTPIVDAGTDATIVNRTAFSRTATESGGGGVTAREWKIQAGPARVGEILSTTTAVSFTPSTSGTYTLRYTATNNIGAGFDDVVVTVTPVVISLDAPASVLQDVTATANLRVRRRITVSGSTSQNVTAAAHAERVTRLDAPVRVLQDVTATANLRVRTLRRVAASSTQQVTAAAHAERVTRLDAPASVLQDVTVTADLEVRRRLTMAAVATQQVTANAKLRAHRYYSDQAANQQATTTANLRAIRYETGTNVTQQVRVLDVAVEQVAKVRAESTALATTTRKLARRQFIRDTLDVTQNTTARANLLPPYTWAGLAKAYATGNLKRVFRKNAPVDVTQTTTATGKLERVTWLSRTVTQDTDAVTPLQRVRLLDAPAAVTQNTTAVGPALLGRIRLLPMYPVVATTSDFEDLAELGLVRLVEATATQNSIQRSARVRSVYEVRAQSTQNADIAGRKLEVAVRLNAPAQVLQNTIAPNARVKRVRKFSRTTLLQDVTARLTLNRRGVMRAQIEGSTDAVTPLIRRIRYRSVFVLARSKFGEKEDRFVRTTAHVESDVDLTRGRHVRVLQGYVTAIGTAVGNAEWRKMTHRAVQKVTATGKLKRRRVYRNNRLAARSTITDEIKQTGMLSTVLEVLDTDPRLAPRPANLINPDEPEEIVPTVFPRTFTRIR